mgnify:CR=1 FL=1
MCCKRYREIGAPEVRRSAINLRKNHQNLALKRRPPKWTGADARAEESGKRGFSSKIARLYIHPGQPPPSAQLSAAGLTRVPLSLPQLHDRPFCRESSLMLSPFPRPTRARTHRMPCALRLRLPSPSLSVSSLQTRTQSHISTLNSQTHAHTLSHITFTHK